jgi:hypothetical protein
MTATLSSTIGGSTVKKKHGFFAIGQLGSGRDIFCKNLPGGRLRGTSPEIMV